MKDYHANAIRNVAILGHLGTGKTSLSEALLFVGGAIDKKGEVERKNNKINFLDTPGNEEFIGEIENVLSVVKGAILLIDASKGVEVGTERSWEELRKRNIPTLI